MLCILKNGLKIKEGLKNQKNKPKGKKLILRQAQDKLKNKNMDFNEYQKKSRETAIYPKKGKNFVYPVLGLVGESGEVAEKIKKVLRDNNGIVGEKQKQGIKKELGDVLWFIAQIATELDLSLNEIASFNIRKLKSRQKRNKLHGGGDNR